MKSSVVTILFTALLYSSLSAAEPSAFAAGDLEVPEPYGLTPSEKVILQNKQKLKKIAVKSNNQENKVDSLRERLDGLQTVIEGLSKKSQNNRLEIRHLREKTSQAYKNTDEYEKRLAQLIQQNTQEIEETKSVVTELSKILNEVNDSYVSKDDFNTLVSDFNKFKELVAKGLKKGYASKSSKLSKLSGAEIAKRAKNYYNKKYYTKAIEYYSELIARNYRPARAHYMIGEMKYYRKNYADAIAYFKKSASLYSKASYMPNLMLHTAISMQKTGDIKKAKSFYNAIIAKYPNTSYSKIAKSKLNKLK